jgi:hypothetical protein
MINDNLQITIYLTISIIAVLITFIMGIYFGNIASSLIRLSSQIILIIIMCIILSYIQQIPYGSIIVWIILFVVIILSLSQLFNMV